MTESVIAKLVYLAEAVCGESPFWDEVNQQLYWADIVKGNIYIFNPKTGSNIEYSIGKEMGALTLREKGGLLVTISNELYFFYPVTGNIELISNINIPPRHIFNDGKCDNFGRFWVGTYHQDSMDSVGVLFSLERDLSFKRKFENISLSNGLTWSIDSSKFYYIDSIAQCIYMFDYDGNSGDISNQKILKRIHGDILLPDGMTIDSEGFLWVAIFNSGKVIRIDPQTGETVFEVLVPNAKQVTSCTFGGKDLNELYITTAKEVDGPFGIPENELSSQYNAGGLFKANLPFRGTPVSRFKY